MLFFFIKKVHLIELHTVAVNLLGDTIIDSNCGQVLWNEPLLAVTLDDAALTQQKHSFHVQSDTHLKPIHNKKPIFTEKLYIRSLHNNPVRTEANFTKCFWSPIIRRNTVYGLARNQTGTANTAKEGWFSLTFPTSAFPRLITFTRRDFLLSLRFGTFVSICLGDGDCTAVAAEDVHRSAASNHTQDNQPANK